jgi:hypothetical protein
MSGEPQQRSFATTAAVLGVIMALLFAVLMTAFFAATERSAWLLRGVLAGFSFGLIMGPTMTFLIRRSETATVAFTDKNAFVSQLNAELAPLGYHPATQGENRITYKFTKGLVPALVPGLSVQMHDGQSMIVGPRMFVRKLLKRIQTR